MTSSVPIALGTHVGPFVVRRRLARRGAGNLYLAHDEHLARDVVLKIVQPDPRGRILREARALAAVDHHAIVRVHAIGEHGDDFYIAMEYVRGNDLSEVIQARGQVHVARALRWVAAAAEGLAAAHAAGVTHHALRPQNVIALDRDRVKVVDFGSASRRGEDVTTSLGSLAYLAPEQIEHGFSDERSDIWALGCILYELTTGSAPFLAATPEALTASILGNEPPYPPQLADIVRDIVSSCLQKSSFARIGSMTELALMARESSESTPSDHRTDPPPRVSQRPSASVVPFRASAPLIATTGRPSERPQSVPPPASFGGGESQRSQALGRGRLKGAPIRAAQGWFARTYGAGISRAIYGRASPELRAIYKLDEPGFGIIPSGWYDAQTMGELLALLEEVASPNDADAFYDKMGAAISRDNVEGVYRSLFRLVTTPEGLQANIQRVWRTYFDDGELVAAVPRSGQVEMSLRAWSGHHPCLCRAVGFGLQHLLREVGWNGLVLERTSCCSDARDATVGLRSRVCSFEGVYLPST